MATGSGTIQIKQLPTTTNMYIQSGPQRILPKLTTLQLASGFSLTYPTDPYMWRTDYAPTGKAAEFVRTGRTTPLPSWFPFKEYTTRDEIFTSGGYAGPLSWYKAAMGGVNTADEQNTPDKDKPCPLPNLFIAAEQDYVCVAGLQLKQAHDWCPILKTETGDCSHWVELEEPERLNRLLVRLGKEYAPEL
jgi:pimeloyl-ACP methyl ester carboxylesterase